MKSYHEAWHKRLQDADRHAEAERVEKMTREETLERARSEKAEQAANTLGVDAEDLKPGAQAEALASIENLWVLNPRSGS